MPTGKGRSLLVALSLLGLVLAVMLGVYATIPARQRPTAAPDPTAQAILDLKQAQDLTQARDLKQAQDLKEAIDQLKALQLAVASDRAEMQRLSGQINALSGKLETRQQSFASVQLAPASPAEPARPRRGAR